MSVVRRSEGLLSRERTLALLRMLRSPDGPHSEVQLVRDFTALHPAMHARTRNTLALLREFGLAVESEGRLGLIASAPTGDSDLEILLAGHIFRTLLQLLGASNASGCVQVRDNGDVWLDSKRLPGAAIGLSFLIIEFGIAERANLIERFWRVGEAFTSQLIGSEREVNRAFRPSPISSDDLELRLAAQAAQGKAAEEWVIDFERRRLNAHPCKDQIRRISEDDVAAGFDIISFSDGSALRYDLFIEVKSYSGARRFFWSRNEIATAKRLGERYSLYLVDRSRMHEPAYAPQIIPGPYATLFESKYSGWSYSAATFEFTAAE